MSQFTIEKGVPIAPHGNLSGLTATLRSLEIGDSFAVRNDEQRKRAVTLARHLRPMKFVTRKTEGKYRIWRTA